jgi:hypothetical protein
MHKNLIRICKILTQFKHIFSTLYIGKYKKINNRKKHNFIKILTKSATCFNPLGIRLIFEHIRKYIKKIHKFKTVCWCL